MSYNTEEIAQAYIPKHNHKDKNQVILLMITGSKKWHYLAVKSLSALLRGIRPKHDRDFYCLNCFHSYSTKNKLKKQERVSYDHDYCHVEMPNEGSKILKYNHREKSNKSSIYDLCWLRVFTWKMHSCQNNPEKSYTEKKN